MIIRVENLPLTTTAERIQRVFERFGVVQRVRLETDDKTGRSLGVGLVIMPDAREASTAIAQLDGTTFEGCSLRLQELRQRANTPRRQR